MRNDSEATADATSLSSLRISRAVEAGRAAAAVDFINGQNDASAAFGAQVKVAVDLRELFVTSYQERYTQFAIEVGAKTAAQSGTCLVLVSVADAIAVGQTMRAQARVAPGGGEALNRVGSQLVSAGMAAQKAAV